MNWIKDGKALPASLRFATDYSPTSGVSHLTVTGTLLTDCGNYTAIAESPLGKAFTSSQVFIKEAPGRNETPDDSNVDDDVPLNRAKAPKVIHPLSSLKHFEGEPVSMACKIDGYPRPKVRFTQKLRYFIYNLIIK